MPEVQSVISRCRECGQADVFAVLHQDLDEGGEPRKWVEQVRLPHDRSDCERMKRLEREQWPTLW